MVSFVVCLAGPAVALGAGAALSLAACNKEPPPKKDEPPKTTPVPSDMVFNDFLQPGGGQVSVRMDGGLEGGLAEATGSAGSPGSAGDSGAADADAGAAAQDEGKLHVTDPGAEPRASRKYAFVANRTDKRVLTMTQSVVGPRGPQEVSIAFTVDFTPKQIKPTGSHFEMKVISIEIPGAQGAEKEAATAQFAAFKGLIGAFDVTPRGEIGQIEFKGDERMQNRMAQTIVQGLQQFAELILPIWPSAPIGVGAKWEAKEDQAEGGVRATSMRKYTLKELTNEGGTVVSEIAIDVPKAPLPTRPGGPIGTVEIHAKGSYTYLFKFDHVSTKVEGELQTKQDIVVAGKPPISETVKAKHTLEPAK
jgi:hypothetical protein